MEQQVLLIAGEKSGEEHSLEFFDRLKATLPQAQFFGVGGDELSARGMELLYHLKDFSSVGLVEVIKKLPFYFKAADLILAEVKKRNCRVAILIDFQDFNLRLAQKLKKEGVSVLYYVAPQAWAWRSSRCKTLAKTVHTLFTILPFEKEWFKERGILQVKGIEHPVFCKLKNQLPPYQAKLPKEKLKLVLLPGSRNVEVKSLLPEMAKALRQLKQQYAFEVTLVKSSSVREENYAIANDVVDEVLYSADLNSVLETADLALASSGTVTMSTALYMVPTLVCYKISWVTAAILWNIVSYRGFIALPNIIHQKEVFPELLQESVTRFNIVKCLVPWFENKDRREALRLELFKTRALLSGDDFDVAAYMADVVNNIYEK